MPARSQIRTRVAILLCKKGPAGPLALEALWSSTHSPARQFCCCRAKKCGKKLTSDDSSGRNPIEVQARRHASGGISERLTHVFRVSIAGADESDRSCPFDWL